MERRIICFLIILGWLASCGPRSIPETRSGRKKAEKIHKIQYENNNYKKKRR
ncbi:MAG TPA: hypothetical protein VD908_03605 [Cytophagales bacterium]|nr:hypothetical protein [Cytophagales bacterium]